ncbi:MAG: chitobiase/beta-hexosaminidase C-terminal domain-containing protein [Oligoflexia bacterium]|nr:chitobiase/beta-hexosaminidase C-terminal domain-containing protein [Oligoflexia bacterium]
MIKYQLQLFLTIIFTIFCLCLSSCTERTKEATAFTTLAPSTSIEPGNYPSSTGTKTIALLSNTKSATIYYTTDGSDPTDKSKVYSSPISLSGSTILKAYAKKDKYKTSEILTANYKILKWTNPANMVVEYFFCPSNCVTTFYKLKKEMFGWRIF